MRCDRCLGATTKLLKVSQPRIKPFRFETEYWCRVCIRSAPVLRLPSLEDGTLYDYWDDPLYRSPAWPKIPCGGLG